MNRNMIKRSPPEIEINEFFRPSFAYDRLTDKDSRFNDEEVIL